MNSNDKLLGLLALIGILAACGPKGSDQSTQGNNTSSLFAAENNRWIAGVSTNPESLNESFATDAIRVMENGQSQDSREAIIAYYHEHPLMAKHLRTLALIAANSDSTIYYEVGTFAVGSSPFKYLVIWHATIEDTVRVFEFIAQADERPTLPATLESRRVDWIRYCNQHDVRRLVDEVYADNPIYFNHKPLVRGREQLKEEYGYMGSDQYRLTLSPLIVEPVSQMLCFEIGQCTGSYNGKYILIWQRNPSGHWQILLDANI